MLLKNKSFTFQQSNLRILFLILTITGFLFTASAQVPGVTTQLIAPTPIEFSDTCLQRIDDNTFVAIAQTEAIVITRDGGYTWQEVTPRPFLTDVREIYIVTPTRWVGVTGYGYVFLTTNGGDSFTSWRLADIFSTPYQEFSISFGDSSNGAMRMNSDGTGSKLFITRNGGESYSPVTLPSGYSSGRPVMFSGNVIVIDTPDKVQRSTNLGVSWSDVFSKTTSDIFKFDDSTAFMIVPQDSVYKTTDKGLTWKAIARINSYILPQYCSRLTDGTVYNYNPYGQQLQVSYDTCKTFQTVKNLPNTGLEMRDIKSLIMTSRERGLAVGRRGSIILLSGPNLDFVNISKNHMWANESFWMDTTFAISGQGERTTDGGRTWARIAFPHELNRTCFPIMFESGTGVIAQNRVVYDWPNPTRRFLDIAVSKDSGLIWQGRVAIESFQAHASTALSDSIFVILADNTSINRIVKFYIIDFRSGNGVASERIADKVYYSVSALPEKNALIALTTDKLYISYDTARTWTLLYAPTFPVSFDYTKIVTAPGGRILLFSNNSQCIESSDYGITWSIRPGYAQNASTSTGRFAVNQKGIIVYGRYQNLYLWYPDGSQKLIHKFLSTTEVTSIQFVGSNILYVHTNFQSVHKFTLDSTLTSVTAEEPLLPETTELLQNYPNPFNSSSIIEYTLSEEGYVTIKLYDITGRLVKQLVNEFKTSGRHKTTIESGNLASGVYIYTLRVNDINISKKLIILK